MTQIGDRIEGSAAALFVFADDASTTVIAETVQGLITAGADISDEVIPPEAQQFIREAIARNAEG